MTIGDVWQAESIPTLGNWIAVCYSDTLDLFVGVNANVGSAAVQVMTSPDGVTWTNRTSGSKEEWECVVWGDGPGLFVAGGGPNVTTNWMTSPDGVTWTSHTPEICGGNTVEGIAYAKSVGKFLAVGGSNGISVSSNGTSWTNFTLSNSSGVALTNAAWDSTRSLWVICDNQTTIWTSSDPVSATSWTKVSTAGSVFPSRGSLAVRPGGAWVLVGDQGTKKSSFSTDAGVTWTQSGLSSSLNWGGVVYDPDDSLFIAIAENGTVAQQIAVSTDGITWTSKTSPNALVYSGIAYGNHKLVALSVGGTVNGIAAIRSTSTTSTTTTGTATGSATVHGVSAATKLATFSATGHAVLSGNGNNRITGIGVSQGTTVLHGVSAAIKRAVGAVIGSAVVQGRSAQGGVGSSTGHATVLGVGQAARQGSGVGNASGSATVNAVSTHAQLGAGTAVGQATVQGVGVTAIFVQALGRVGALGTKALASFTMFLRAHGIVLAAGEVRRVPSIKGVPIVFLQGQQSGIELLANTSQVKLQGNVQE